MLRILQEELDDIQVDSAMADYENGLRAALIEEFPGTDTKGCWFHFSQAVVRRAKKLWLWQLNAEAKTCIKMAAALPLLPNNMINEAINIISAIPRRSPNWNSFFRYLRHWTNKNISVHGHSMRTNNNVEAFNRSLVRVEKLRLFDDESNLEVIRQANGVRQPARRKMAYKALDPKNNGSTGTIGARPSLFKTHGPLNKFVRAKWYV